MLSALITFLSSSAGGALIGWLQSRMDEKRKDEREDKQRAHQREMAGREDALKVYDKAIEASQIKPITYTKLKETTRLKWFLFGEPFQTKTVKSVDRLSRTPREKTIAVIVTMFAATYCLICLWVGFWFMADVSIIPPNSKQTGIDLLLFKVAFGGNKPVDQAVLGPLLYMLSPILFISSNWMIRKNPNK